MCHSYRVRENCCVRSHSFYVSFIMRSGLKYSTPAINLFTTYGRLKTFSEDWVHTDWLTPRKLAEAGLFRCPLEVINTTYKDCVMCPYCDICLASWEGGDTGLVEHARWSPSCPFIRRFPEGTIDPEECALVFPKSTVGGKHHI
jgi:hypothetical protein